MKNSKDRRVSGKRNFALPLLMSRREVLQSHVLSKLAEPIRESPTFDARLADLIQSGKAQGLEGLVAKR